MVVGVFRHECISEVPQDLWTCSRLHACTCLLMLVPSSISDLFVLPEVALILKMQYRDPADRVINMLPVALPRIAAQLAAEDRWCNAYGHKEKLFMYFFIRLHAQARSSSTVLFTFSCFICVRILIRDFTSLWQTMFGPGILILSG